MHGVGTSAEQPLSQTWMTKQWQLQKQILARMRALGIVPVLPAFQGNVPPVMKTELFKDANISVQGTGRHYAAWLDGTDKLFVTIGIAYMKQLCADFGCQDHWYEADGYFAAGNPPWLKSALQAQDPINTSTPNPAAAAAKARAENAYRAINTTDPDAIWLYQGWILPGAAPFTQGLVSAVELGRLVISDMRCEDPNGCEWTDDYGQHGSFYGAPFIWGTLHNFGGNLGMWGSLPHLATAPLQAFCNASSVTGVGMLPEGIDQNTPWSTFLMDTNWVASAHDATTCDSASTLLDVDVWVRRWAVERYGYHHGVGEAEAQQAWALLSSTVYGAHQGRGTDQEDQADGLTSYPIGAQQEHTAPKPDWYSVNDMRTVWELLVTLAEKRQAHASTKSAALPATLRYDIVNTGREVLAKISNRLFNATTAAATSSALATAMPPMLGILADADELLCVDNGFSMDEWIRNARKWGVTPAEQDRMEWAARAQPTTWLPACPPSEQPTSNRTRGICGARSDLADYSNKQWSGLVNSYYAGRYHCYNETASHAFDTKTGRDATWAAAYNLCIDAWSWEWQHDFGGKKYPLCKAPVGDAVAVSRRLLAKYKDSLA